MDYKEAMDLLKSHENLTLAERNRIIGAIENRNNKLIVFYEDKIRRLRLTHSLDEDYKKLQLKSIKQ